MRLAPDKLMRGNIGCFAKVDCTRILPCVQVSHVNQDPVRYAVVRVAGVVICGRGECASERIDPGAGADAVLVTIQA